MLQLMAMMGDLQPLQLWGAIAGDVVMVLTGLAASWTSGALQVSGLAPHTSQPRPAGLVTLATVLTCATPLHRPVLCRQHVMLVASFAGFGVVVAAIIVVFGSAMAETTADPGARLLLRRMLLLTLVVWSLFPLVWMAGYARLVSLHMEQVRRRATAAGWGAAGQRSGASRQRQARAAHAGA